MTLLKVLEKYSDGSTREARLFDSFENELDGKNMYIDISTWSVNHENCTDTVRIRAKDLEFYSKFMPELQQLLLVL